MLSMSLLRLLGHLLTAMCLLLSCAIHHPPASLQYAHPCTVHPCLANVFVTGCVARIHMRACALCLLWARAMLRFVCAEHAYIRLCSKPSVLAFPAGICCCMPCWRGVSIGLLLVASPLRSIARAQRSNQEQLVVALLCSTGSFRQALELGTLPDSTLHCFLLLVVVWCSHTWAGRQPMHACWLAGCRLLV